MPLSWANFDVGLPSQLRGPTNHTDYLRRPCQHLSGRHRIPASELGGQDNDEASSVTNEQLKHYSIYKEWNGVKFVSGPV